MGLGHSAQISAFQSFRIQNCDLKTIFNFSNSTSRRAAETAVYGCLSNKSKMLVLDYIVLLFKMIYYQKHQFQVIVFQIQQNR